MYAGVKTNCLAASTAGSLKISRSLFSTTTCFTLPSLSTQIFTNTRPSRPARIANSGYLGSTRLTMTGSFSTATKSAGGASSSILMSCCTATSSPPFASPIGVTWLICSCVWITWSALTSASGTGTGTPTVGFAVGAVTATGGGMLAFDIDGGGPRSEYFMSLTWIIGGSSARRSSTR